MVAAHRGLPGAAIENTITSAQQAIGAGADMIELDVHHTRDGALVVHHDAHIGEARIRFTNFADLPALADGTTYAPTLGAFADAVRGRALLDVELKERFGARDVVDALARHAVLDDSFVTSFYPGAIRDAKAYAPRLHTGLLISEPGAIRWLVTKLSPDFEFLRALRAHADVIAPEHSLVTPQFLDRANRYGLRVVPWTVNDPARIEQLLRDPRVETVITDRSDLAAGIRRRLLTGLR